MTPAIAPSASRPSRTEPGRTARFERIGEYATFVEAPDSGDYVRPLWFWNTAIDESLITSQMDAMYAQGLRRFYIHSRSGMRPKYLTEEWWRLIGVAVAHARRRGMRLGLVDEFNWPSGELRDYSLDGIPSRVINAMPDARMRMLVETEGETETAATVKPFLVVHEAVDPVRGEDTRGDDPIVPADLHLAEECRRPSACRVFSYAVVPTDGVDGGLVDLLNPAAVDVFIDSFYGELVRRFPSDAGSTIFGAFCDHEGDFGRRLVYTPSLFDEFQARKGYDLRPLLPLLSREADGATAIRRDWFDVVSSLYAENFFGRIVAFAKAHSLEVTGHTWEESLLLEAAFEGSAPRIHRQWSNPGVDSLAEWGRRPRHLREGLSVARIYGRDLVVESQGVQGAGSYLSPERIRRQTDMLIAWGANVLCPHALNADRRRTDFPEDWFLSQPWWPHFRAYVDYATRLAASNGVGHPVPAAAIVYPIESIWAHSRPYFDAGWDYSLSPFTWRDGPKPQWRNDADEVEACYDEIIEALSAAYLDYDIIDLDALEGAQVVDGQVTIGEMRYPGLIVPAMTFVDRRLQTELTRLATAGVPIRIIRPRADPVVEMAGRTGRLDWAGRFAARHEHPNVHLHDDVPSMVTGIERDRPRPWTLTATPADRVRVSARRADDGWLLWIVADGAAAEAMLTTPVGTTDAIEINPETGGRTRLAFDSVGANKDRADDDSENGDRTLTLSLAAGRGRLLWLSTETCSGTVKALTLISREDPVARSMPAGASALSTGWTIELPDDPECALPWVSAGAATGTPVAVPDSGMEPFWMGAARAGLREWMLIGPFPNADETGWGTVFPPEYALDPHAVYRGRGGRPVRWTAYRSPGPVVSFDDALGLTDPESNGSPECTVYAHTSVHSPKARRVVLAAVGDSNVKAWVNGTAVLDNRDDHSGYVEMTAAFAQTTAIDLRPGWNTVLFKVTRGNRPQRQCRLTAWLAEEDGTLAAGLRHHPCGGGSKAGATAVVTTPPHIRTDLPAGTRHLVIPGAGADVRAWIDGEPIVLREGVAQFEPVTRAARLDLSVGSFDQLLGPIVATVGRARCDLGNLTATPLRFVSGTLRYRCTAQLPPLPPGCRVELALGDVGVAASVQINGTALPARAWPPFTWEVTGVVTTGTNDIVVDVSNTRAGRRAAESTHDGRDLVTHGPDLLTHLDLNGLHGPVRIQWSE